MNIGASFVIRSEQQVKEFSLENQTAGNDVKLQLKLVTTNFNAPT